MRTTVVALVVGFAAFAGAQPSTASLGPARRVQLEVVAGRHAIAGGVRWNRGDYGALRIDGWNVQRENRRRYSTGETVERSNLVGATIGGDVSFRRGPVIGSVLGGLGRQNVKTVIDGHGSGSTDILLTAGAQVRFGPVLFGLHIFDTKGLYNHFFTLFAAGIRY